MNDLNNWIMSPNIIILYYRNYSCGKFVSNILSFNENFVAQVPLTPRVKRYNSRIESLAHNFNEELLTDYKLEQIFLTIPPTKTQCKNWTEYELGCSMFWGFWTGDLNFSNLHPLAVECLNQNKYCFIAAHSYNDWQLLASKFPNATTIELVNDSVVRQRSIELKTNYMAIDLSRIRSIENSIKFDIGSLFNKQKFFNNINELLLTFDIPNRELNDQVYKYYQQYIDLYE
jgi:hypothetical protein